MPKNQQRSIEEQYEEAFRTTAAVNPVFTHSAKQQMVQMVEEIARSDENMQTFMRWESDPSRKGGFLAEEWHSDSFNLDSILKGKTVRAETGLDNNVLGNNDATADIAIVDGDKVIKTAQVKYYKDAESTSHAHSVLDKNGDVKYQGADTALSPSDQVEGIKEHAAKAGARHLERAESSTDPQMEALHRNKANAYAQTGEKTSGTLEHDGVKSSPLSKAEANELGENDPSKVKEMRSDYQDRSTLQQMGNAAVGAAAMSAVISGAMNTVRYLGMAREGKISQQEAAVKIITETVCSATDSAVKASAIVGVNSLMVRGGEQVVLGSLAQQGVSTILRGNAVAIGTVCVINAVKDLVSLSMGNMSKEEFEERQGKGILNTSAGVMGASLGGLAGAGLVASFSGTAAAATTATATAASTSTIVATASAFFTVPVMVPFITAMAGGIIATMAMNLAVENHIEKPYRDLVRNSRNMVESVQILEQVSASIFQGQVYFRRFLEMDAELDSAFQQQTQKGRKTMADMRAAIDRI